MEFYRFVVQTPYCGTTENHYEQFPEGVTVEELEEYLGELVYQHAESFEYLEFGWGGSNEEMSEEGFVEAQEAWVARCMEESYYEEIMEEEFNEREG